MEFYFNFFLLLQSIVKREIVRLLKCISAVSLVTISLSSQCYFCFHDVHHLNVSFTAYAPLDVEFTRSQVVAAIPGTFFCVWYVAEKHWLANNILGLAFCIQV